jgi:hypothetical protein
MSGRLVLVRLPGKETRGCSYSFARAQNPRHVTVALDAQTDHEPCGETAAATGKYEASTPGTRRSVPRLVVECHGWDLISRGWADKVVQSVVVPVLSTPDESPDGIFKVTSSVSVTRLPSANGRSKCWLRSSSQKLFMCPRWTSKAGRIWWNYHRPCIQPSNPATRC